MLADVVEGVRLLAGVPRHVRSRLSLEEARAIVVRRLENREADLVRSVQHNIYGYAGSPWRRLLEHAGVNADDFAALVDDEGAEGALGTLLRAGVYVTMDEFRGRRPIVRGSLSFTASPLQFRNPGDIMALPGQTSGSSGRSTFIPLALGYVGDRMANQLISLHARGGDNWVIGYWRVPGASALAHMLNFTALGARPDRWFSPVDPRQQGLHPRYWWSARLVSLTAALAGNPIPTPRFVPPGDPGVICDWMEHVLRAGKRPRMFTFASLAVRLSLAAQERGLDLTGVEFCTGGEPTTRARLEVICASGADVVPLYGAGETGSLGRGCAAPTQPDDMHLMTDMNVHIQPGPDGAALGLPERALLVSSLRPDAALILLNLAIGDEAVFERRQCGCLLDEVGWHYHVHHVRSYEKLTAAGMNFLDSKVIEVLDVVLPREFGGRPTDYQLAEGESPEGLPRLILRVHPSVGPLDPEAAKRTFLESLDTDNALERIMRTMWQTGISLEVERTEPRIGSTGKILHLHRQREPAGAQ